MIPTWCSLPRSSIVMSKHRVSVLSCFGTAGDILFRSKSWDVREIFLGDLSQEHSYSQHVTRANRFQNIAYNLSLSIPHAIYLPDDTCTSKFDKVCPHLQRIPRSSNY